MLAEDLSLHWGYLMFNGVINKGSPAVDQLEVISGVWNEYNEGEWHIVKTPMFLVITGTLDAGQHVLPFNFDLPVAGTLVSPDGDVLGLVIRPGETAIDVSKPGLVTFQVFGDHTRPHAVK